MKGYYFMSKMKVASMFAGIGGICLAFKKAGYSIAWANEKDSRACNTYRRNFGEKYLCERDIATVDTHTIPAIDILAAGFPCQPFSIAGMQKGFQDHRGNMFFEIIRVAKNINPRVIFLENVANLKWHDNGNTFSVIMRTLNELGYFVQYKILAANEYANIPQTRQRIFIVAFKSEEECLAFHFPKPVRPTIGINSIINRTVKYHDIYYYSGKMEEELSRHITDRNSIYQIMDHGIRKVKNNMCPTLTANMGTFPRISTGV